MIRHSVLASVLLVASLAGAFVLHDNVKVINIGEDLRSGKLRYDTLRLQPNAGVNPTNILKNSAFSKYLDHKKVSAAQKIRTDYVGSLPNLTYSSVGINTAGPQDIVVELLIVCDKDFGDVFQHDRTKILEYLTVYFWDITNKFKTLPSVNLSFRVTGVVVTSTPAAQPFIENARDSNGQADLFRILPLFWDWVPEHAANFPQFDLAVLITYADLEWKGGIAGIGAACLGKGVVAFSDFNGGWMDTPIAAHEIAHALGAWHDYDTECRDGGGYIMNGGSDDFKWFFSSCSDEKIKEYVTSDQASCLRHIDEPSQNPISSDFSDVLAQTAEEQCKQTFGPGAFMEEADKSNCLWLRCPNRNWWWTDGMGAVENTICSSDGGRCFRGICRAPDYLIQNVATFKCLKAPNQFAFTVNIQLVDCPRYGTPYDRFATNDWPNGVTLSTPWQTPDATEHGERCIYTGNAEGDGLWTDRCSQDNPWHGWDFFHADYPTHLILRHRVTLRCAKQEGSQIVMRQCNPFDPSFQWTILLTTEHDTNVTIVN